MPQDSLEEQTGDREYSTRDQGLAAYLATKFMFMGAVETGEKTPGGHDTIKEFQFLMPLDEEIERHIAEYMQGADPSKVPAIVMFNKLRLMRQACRKPLSMDQLSLGAA